MPTFCAKLCRHNKNGECDNGCVKLYDEESRVLRNRLKKYKDLLDKFRKEVEEIKS